MSILWCGGEDIDFTNNMSAIFVHESIYHEVGYARCTILNSMGSYSDPFPGGAITSCWFSASVFSASTAFTSTIFGLGKYGSANKIVVYCSGTDGLFSIGKSDGTTITNLATGTTATIMLGVLLRRFDLQVINFGASATLNLYIDGYFHCTFSGDPRPSGMNDIDCVWAYGHSGYYYLSQFIVADEDTRFMKLVTHYPSAAGDTNDWTGAYTDIDETTLNDLDHISTDNIDDDFQCNLSNLPSGTFDIEAVKIAVRAATTDSGSIKLGIESGGTINVGDPQTLDKYWITYERLMQTNPITAAAFTPAEINALQLTLRSDS